MEVLDKIWAYVLPVGGGITLGAAIIAILVPVIKGVITRAVAKIDVEAVEKKAVDKGLDKIKTVSFKQSIQPVVESELRKVTEEANTYIKAQIDELNYNYVKLVTILTKLSAYFDNSIAVSDTAKAELKQALADAQKTANIEQDIEVEEFVVQTPIVEIKPENGDDSGYITVER